MELSCTIESQGVIFRFLLIFSSYCNHRLSFFLFKVPSFFCGHKFDILLKVQFLFWFKITIDFYLQFHSILFLKVSFYLIFCFQGTHLFSILYELFDPLIFLYDGIVPPFFNFHLTLLCLYDANFPPFFWVIIHIWSFLCVITHILLTLFPLIVSSFDFSQFIIFI